MSQSSGDQDQRMQGQLRSPESTTEAYSLPFNGDLVIELGISGHSRVVHFFSPAAESGLELLFGKKRERTELGKQVETLGVGFAIERANPLIQRALRGLGAASLGVEDLPVSDDPFYRVGRNLLNIIAERSANSEILANLENPNSRNRYISYDDPDSQRVQKVRQEIQRGSNLLEQARGALTLAAEAGRTTLKRGGLHVQRILSGGMGKAFDLISLELQGVPGKNAVKAAAVSLGGGKLVELNMPKFTSETDFETYKAIYAGRLARLLTLGMDITSVGIVGIPVTGDKDADQSVYEELRSVTLGLIMLRSYAPNAWAKAVQ